MSLVGMVKILIECIREQINTGELAPGQKLSEIQLSAKLNISRPAYEKRSGLLKRNSNWSASQERVLCLRNFVRKFAEVYEARLMMEENAFFLKYPLRERKWVGYEKL